MSSRDKILAAVAQNQPQKTELPDVTLFKGSTEGLLEKYTKVLTGIGGKIYCIDNLAEIDPIITDLLGKQNRVINLVPGVNLINAEVELTDGDVHELENVDLALIKAHFAVAENGAVWITEELMDARVLPFITQHLAVIIHQKDIVPDMHEAYEQLNSTPYGYGSFIAGPSKTADIEQSLVIGAHGPRSMMVFVLLDQNATR